MMVSPSLRFAPIGREVGAACGRTQLAAAGQQGGLPPQARGLAPPPAPPTERDRAGRCDRIRQIRLTTALPRPLAGRLATAGTLLVGVAVLGAGCGGRAAADTFEYESPDGDFTVRFPLGHDPVLGPSIDEDVTSVEGDEVTTTTFLVPDGDRVYVVARETWPPGPVIELDGRCTDYVEALLPPLHRVVDRDDEHVERQGRPGVRSVVEASGLGGTHALVVECYLDGSSVYVVSLADVAGNSVDDEDATQFLGSFTFTAERP